MRVGILSVALLVVIGLFGSVCEGANATECATYCATYNASCPLQYAGYYPLYMGVNTCMTQCMFFPDDPTLSTSGDSYQCRLYHAQVAGSLPQPANAIAHCPHPLPDGANGVCGTACDNYCDKAMMCTGANQLYSSRASCENECLYFPSTGTYGDMTGDTLQCRTTLATEVLLLPTACVAAGAWGGASAATATCGTPCQNYCDHYNKTCSSVATTYQYASNADCLTQCATWTVILPLNYVNFTAAGNSFNCRSYHVLVAGLLPGNAVPHCPHAAPDGGTVCVAPPTVAPTSPSASFSLVPSYFIVLALLVASFKV